MKRKENEWEMNDNFFLLVRRWNEIRACSCQRLLFLLSFYWNFFYNFFFAQTMRDSHFHSAMSVSASTHCLMSIIPHHIVANNALCVRELYLLRVWVENFFTSPLTTQWFVLRSQQFFWFNSINIKVRFQRPREILKHLEQFSRQ